MGQRVVPIDALHISNNGLTADATAALYHAHWNETAALQTAPESSVRTSHLRGSISGPSGAP